MNELIIHRITFGRVRELLQASSLADSAAPVDIGLIDIGDDLEECKFFEAPVGTHPNDVAYDRISAVHEEFGLIRVYQPRFGPRDHGYATVA
jgi:hypothetical protein